MPQSLIFTLLLLALALPVLGAFTLRLLGARLTLAQLYAAAILILGIAIVSVLLLARSDIPNLQIGSLSVLLPVTAPDDSDLGLAPTIDAQAPVPDTTRAPAEPAQPPSPSPAATASPTPSPTAPASPTAAPTQAPTAAPTEAPTVLPTEAPTVLPTATSAPTAAPPTAARPARRTYTVQPGDTLLSIAEKFKTTVPAIVAANKLTPQQADSLRIGQVLIIP